MNALIDYSRLYESEAPSFTLRTFFDGDALGESDVRRSKRPARRAPARASPDRPRKVRTAAPLEARTGTSLLLRATLLFPEGAQDGAGERGRRDPEGVQREARRRVGAAPGAHANRQRGELVKVDLFLSLPAPRNFLVVDDPVPGGLEPVNRDLATASTVDADEAEFQGASTSFWFTRDDWFRFAYSRWSFYHQELRHDAARFYSEWLPAGNYHLSYAAQAIAPGEFQVLPVARRGDVRPRRLRTGRSPDARGRGETLTRKLARSRGRSPSRRSSPRRSLSLSPVPAQLPPVDERRAVEPRYVDRRGELLSVTYENPWNLHERIAASRNAGRFSRKRS